MRQKGSTGQLSLVSGNEGQPWIYSSGCNKACKEAKPYCIPSFLDIMTYDSVNRELLYLKLDSLRFGGKVKQIKQSMYFNDNVRARLCGGLSNPLWLTRGVKGGCVLSPLLFSLYVSGLAKVLHSMKEGVQ